MVCFPHILSSIIPPIGEVNIKLIFIIGIKKYPYENVKSGL